MDDINALVQSLLRLGLDVTKGYKAHKGISGYIDAVVADQAVIESLKQVIGNISKLPADFKAMTLSDGLALIAPVISGVEAIVNEVKA